MGCGASSPAGAASSGPGAQPTAARAIAADPASGVAYVSDLERGDGSSPAAAPAAAAGGAGSGAAGPSLAESSALQEITALAEADSAARIKSGAFSMMVFSSAKYDQDSFDGTLAKLKAEGTITADITINYTDASLSKDTVRLAIGYDGICVFVNDRVDSDVIHWLKRYSKNTRLIALRCVGFNNVDMKVAAAAKLTVVRAAGYSPYSVAEHAVGLMLSLNRKIHKAYAKTRDLNFSLVGLTGFDVHGKTVGVIGAGRIGICVCNIYKGFGAKVLYQNRSQKPALDEIGCEKVELDEMCKRADIISIHVAATPQTFHMLDKVAFEKMKPNVIIINAARGDVIHTTDLLDALDTKQIGGAGLDVMENEAGVFFYDVSDNDGDENPENRKTLTRLVNHRRVLLTGHQAFLTEDALEDIANCTLGNVTEYMEKVVAVDGTGGVVADMKNQISIDAQQLEEELRKMARTKWKGAGAALKLRNL